MILFFFAVIIFLTIVDFDIEFIVFNTVVWHTSVNYKIQTKKKLEIRAPSTFLTHLPGTATLAGPIAQYPDTENILPLSLFFNIEHIA